LIFVVIIITIVTTITMISLCDYARLKDEIETELKVKAELIAHKYQYPLMTVKC